MIADAPRWPQIDDVRRTDDGVELEIRLPPDLFWFRGHFPQVPILPGVVQIDWAIQYAREHLDVDLPAARVFKVKFRQVIRPGEYLTLRLQHRRNKGHLLFEYQRGQSICASGQVTIVP
jgi:3-hydroxymyristoyl/3-hydroxydecanoyl-(acyl carrier protein) dehydratase